MFPHAQYFPHSVDDIFVNGKWNLEKIKNYSGDPPAILARVLRVPSCSVDIVKLLLQQGADINCEDEFFLFCSPLMVALAISRDESVIRLLLEEGANVNQVNRLDTTPLLVFLRREDYCSVGILKVLLDFNVDINQKHKKGYSPLTAAIRNTKDDAVIQVLIERGAKVNDLVNLHDTPLLVLLRSEKNYSVDTVKLLLAKGADINCVDKRGDSPLVAALKNCKDKKIIQALLEGGADVNIACENGKTPLLLLLRDFKNYCLADIVKLLLLHKADVNCKNSFGNSPLMTAIILSRDETIIRMLLESGADVNVLDRDGRSLLCHAFRKSSNDIAKLFLDAGASPNACNLHSSGLHCATHDSKSGLREDILRQLLETVADVNRVDRCGSSVLCYALQKGAETNEIQLLLDVGCSLNACRYHSTALLCATDVIRSVPLRKDVVQLLLDNGVCVGDSGLKILQGALRRCQYETGAIELLLDIPGMNAHVVDNGVEESLLHLAVQNPYYRLDTIKLLLDRKAQVHAKTQKGDTPMHCAVRNTNCDPNVVDLLLQNGSPVNAKNALDETPLMLAVIYTCDVNILKELLIAGADIEKTEFTHCLAHKKKCHLIEFLVREYESTRSRERNILREKLALTELLGSEYMSKRSGEHNRLNNYKMLGKFFLLQNPKCVIEDFQKASAGKHARNIDILSARNIDKLLMFVKECLSELEKMDLIQAGQGRTFRQFIAGNTSDESYDLGQILKNITQNTFPGFLDNFFASFPVFHDIIFAKVKKLMIEQKYCPDFLIVRSVNLSSAILYEISGFLSDDDFLKFILAFYNLGELNRNNEPNEDKPLLKKVKF